WLWPQALFRVVRFNLAFPAVALSLPATGSGFIFMLSLWFVTDRRSAAPSLSGVMWTYPVRLARQKVM
ncbi:hypothetical protein, partial [Salmonella enterica]|uniref:hypothetical protein n=1 Tax=Salmonella enterica TaxID=28901 RepID=UPI001C376C16